MALLIRPNVFDRPIFKIDRLGFLLVTPKWVFATRLYAGIF